MTGKISVARSIAASETVRKARELAWGACLAFPFVIFFIGVALMARGPENYSSRLETSELIVFLGALVSLVVIFLRFLYVSVRLGIDYKNIEFLQTQRPEHFPLVYLLKRVIGLSTRAE